MTMTDYFHLNFKRKLSNFTLPVSRNTFLVLLVMISFTIYSIQNVHASSNEELIEGQWVKYSLLYDAEPHTSLLSSFFQNVYGFDPVTIKVDYFKILVKDIIDEEAIFEFSIKLAGQKETVVGSYIAEIGDSLAIPYAVPTFSNTGTMIGRTGVVDDSPFVDYGYLFGKTQTDEQLKVVDVVKRNYFGNEISVFESYAKSFERNGDHDMTSEIVFYHDTKTGIVLEIDLTDSYKNKSEQGHFHYSLSAIEMGFENTELDLQNEKLGFSKYENDKVGISFDYPENWHILDYSTYLFNGRAPPGEIHNIHYNLILDNHLSDLDNNVSVLDNNVTLLFEPPYTGIKYSGSSEEVWLYVRTLQSPMTAEEYGQTENSIPHYYLSSDPTPTTLAGIDAYETLYRSGDGIDHMIWTVKNNNAYVLLYRASAYDYKPDYESVQILMNSIKIDSPKFESVTPSQLTPSIQPPVPDPLTQPLNSTPQIPEWIRNNAVWWIDGKIDDKTFVSGIEFLIKEGMIIVPESTSPPSQEEKSNEVPEWIKNNADWWSQGLISDDDFLKGIQYLVENEIVKI